MSRRCPYWPSLSRADKNEEFARIDWLQSVPESPFKWLSTARSSCLQGILTQGPRAGYQNRVVRTRSCFTCWTNGGRERFLRSLRPQSPRDEDSLHDVMYLELIPPSQIQSRQNAANSQNRWNTSNRVETRPFPDQFRRPLALFRRYIPWTCWLSPQTHCLSSRNLKQFRIRRRKCDKSKGHDRDNQRCSSEVKLSLHFQLGWDARHSVHQRSSGDDGHGRASELADIVDQLPLSSEVARGSFGLCLVRCFGGRNE